MTPSLYLSDMIKNALLGTIIGLPVLWILLVIMEKTGTWWWLYAWILWSAFQYLMLFIYPTFIAPLFNKFSPLTDEKLRDQIERLMQRIGFRSKGLYIMDGSKRSSHGNAYFTGFGSAKRVVFFDTLIERLSPEEIEAVLAHELGHFRLKHVIKRIVFTSAASLVFLALLGFLKNESWFYAGLGIAPDLASNAVALILFALTLPIFTFFLSPVLSMSSRKHEFEADDFSARHTDAGHLVSALVKMYEDNASTLTPDPLHSAFYDSHPPASIRINHLLRHS
jgi:STE24 endopeptidase